MPEITFYGKSDVGLRRKNNEDAFIVKSDKLFCLAADGMGGAAAGELASAIFAKTAVELLSQKDERSEDDAVMLQLIRRTLESQDYDVITAADGVIGLALLREFDPDMVLMDIMMPGPDGYLTLERIREFSDVPVIMVSAKSEVDSVQKALDLGADDYVRKPFRPLELAALVEEKLRSNRQEAGVFLYSGIVR